MYGKLEQLATLLLCWWLLVVGMLDQRKPRTCASRGVNGKCGWLLQVLVALASVGSSCSTLVSLCWLRRSRASKTQQAAASWLPFPLHACWSLLWFHYLFAFGVIISMPWS